MRTNFAAVARWVGLGLAVASAFQLAAPPLRRRTALESSGSSGAAPEDSSSESSSEAESASVVGLGCLPFDVVECLLPGNRRYVHLYESKFLELFQAATQKDDGLVVCAYVTDRQTLLAKATLAKIESWRRLEVGVGANLLAVDRCDIVGVDVDDPDRSYLVANVATQPSSRRREPDAPTTASVFDAGDVFRSVAELDDELRDLTRRHGIDRRSNQLAVDPRAVLVPFDSDSDSSSSDDRPAGFDDAGNNKGESDDCDAPIEDRAAELLRTLHRAYPSPNHSIAGLVGYLAFDAAEPHRKIEALALDAGDRLVEARKHLAAARDDLVAKAAIKSLNLDWEENKNNNPRPPAAASTPAEEEQQQQQSGESSSPPPGGSSDPPPPSASSSS